MLAGFDGFLANAFTAVSSSLTGTNNKGLSWKVHLNEVGLDYLIPVKLQIQKTLKQNKTKLLHIPLLKAKNPQTSVFVKG